MTSRIEDYAAIGNCETVAMVGRDGSIDWLGFPRFDSAACFAALLGDSGNGRWIMAPVGPNAQVTRRYRGDTMILETTFDVGEGTVVVIDLLTRRDGASDLVRIVRGVRGSVAMHTELVVRFDHGCVVPWVERQPDKRREFIAGPDRLTLATDVPLRGRDFRTVGTFEVAAGDEVSFMLTWSPSYRPMPEAYPAQTALQNTEEFWTHWSKRFKRAGEWPDAVMRSLLVLKALTHRETGGIVAAGTTSVPEKIGGQRNWDYRYCWLRDATFTLYALVGAGYTEEAKAWREWLLRAVAGTPNELQIMYGVGGERRLDEHEIPWLSGYENSKPVRVGNAASGQIQLDVYGEVIDALYTARKAGIPANKSSWSLECALLAHLETIWQQPDDGIWEVRGGRKHFTHSKVMAWVAFDRAVRTVEEFGLDGPVAHWREVRDAIHKQVCERGFDAGLNSFVQHYGSKSLDASLLLLAIVGFLPASDPRISGTLAAIESNLVHDGLVQRYHTSEGTDGLPSGEGAFLACSLWLADNYILQGRDDEARGLFELIISLRNDVGLLSEEYDPDAKRQLGNFPQAFSHLALINTARNLRSSQGAAHQRSNSASGETHDDL